MRSLRSWVTRTMRTPVSCPFRPTFHASATCMAEVKSSSGSVVGIVRTAISAPVLSLSAWMVCVIRWRASGGMTPARSVTYPCGCGTGGSAACAASAISTVSRTPRARFALRIERVERVDDSLNLPEILADLEAQAALDEARHAFSIVEQAAHQWQGAQHLLPHREYLAVGGARIVSLQPQQVAEEDQHALERLEHQPLERARGAGGGQVESAQSQELAAGLLLALATEGAGIDGHGRQHVRTGQDAMLAPDVVELHGEGVARPLEERALDEERRGEAALLPSHDDGGKRLEHVDRDRGDHHRDVDVGVWLEVVAAGG